eukprot:scaffold94055_cov37-Phaeocystis_antarctica.AAC.1
MPVMSWPASPASPSPPAALASCRPTVSPASAAAKVGGVVVEVSLKVAATKSSVTMALKKICDTCVRGRGRGGIR